MYFNPIKLKCLFSDRNSHDWDTNHFGFISFSEVLLFLMSIPKHRGSLGLKSHTVFWMEQGIFSPGLAIPYQSSELPQLHFSAG